MKAFTLLLLRLCTGLYLIAWGAVKFVHPERAIEISNRFYGSDFNNPVVQLAFGVVAGVIGIFVILGFLRRFSYSVQAVILGVSAAAVGKALFQPLISDFHVVLLIDAATGFVPSLTLFIASLIPFAFWKYDFVALDLDEIGDVEKRKMKAAQAAPVAAAAATTVVDASEGHAEVASEAVEEAAVEEVQEAPAESAHPEPMVEAHAGPAPAAPEPVVEEAVVEEPVAEMHVAEEPVEETWVVEAHSASDEVAEAHDEETSEHEEHDGKPEAELAGHAAEHREALVAAH